MVQQNKALCSKCATNTSHTIKARAVEGVDSVTEYGVVCDECGNWVHSCYSNAKLDQMRADIKAEHHPDRNAKLVRYYHRKFEAFQDEMARTLAG